MDYDAIGARIRKARRAMGMTQSELADKVGLSTSFLGHIERGSRIASLETMSRISDALGLTLDILVYGPERYMNYPLPHEMSLDQRKVINDVIRVLSNNYEEWK